MKDKFPRVPYGSTVHGEDEINAVLEVLKSSTQMGENVNLFEHEIASIFEKDFGLMTNSGTSALYLAMECLDLPKGSEIITPVLTFATTVASVVKNGYIHSFTDVKKNSFCIDVEQIESRITKNTKAILAPDLLGNICEWDKIKQMADENNLLVLHDSADTLGSLFKGESTNG